MQRKHYKITPEGRTNLARETKAGGDTGHCGRNEVVQVTVGRRRQLERTEADVV